MGAPGCDDAPIVTVPRAEKSKRVTMVIPYYENPAFLAIQIAGWAKYPKIMRGFLRVIVVDDGSPKSPAEGVMSKYPYSFLRLFRIHKDVRWNWLAARNIGAQHADTSWILLTDVDHVVDSQVMLNLMNGAHDEGVIYRFSRREHDGRKIHPHPNSWFMTRSMYWKVGGYDEALSGYYGTDGEYRRRCAATAPIRILTDELERHEHIGDSSTIGYKRKQPEDAAVKRMVASRPHGWRPRTLSFPYEEIAL